MKSRKKIQTLKLKNGQVAIDLYDSILCKIKAIKILFKIDKLIVSSTRLED